MKVAIVGLSPSTRDKAPWGDPEWQLWGLAWDVERYRFHRAFEMHDRADLERTYGERLADHLEKLEGCNLVTPENFPWDMEEGLRYWTSSVSFALSLAIHEGAEEIALWGIDANDDYGYQRPSLEYLIGFARGRGIKVHVPEESPLCKFLNPPDRDYAGVYGRTK